MVIILCIRKNKEIMYNFFYVNNLKMLDGLILYINKKKRKKIYLDFFVCVYVGCGFI